MTVEVDKLHDAISNAHDTLFKNIKLYANDLPNNIRKRLKIKNRLKKKLRVSKCHFDKRLLKKAQTKYKELIAIHRPRFCHEFITVLDEKELTTPWKVIKKCKTTKIRTAPLVGSSIPVFSNKEKVQELVNSIDYLFFRNGYFISKTEFIVHGSSLHYFNYCFGHKIQPCKQTELSKYVSKIKRKKCCLLNRITNENKNFQSLLEIFHFDFGIDEDSDINKELSYFLDLPDEEPNSINISSDKNENFDTDICEDMNKECSNVLDLKDEEPNYRNISMELCMFYYEAIRKLIGKNDFYFNVKCLRHYFYLIRPVTDSWCRFKNCAEELTESKETLYYRIAYLYRNSTCISSAVAHHFLKAVNKHLVVVKELFEKKKLRICSIGCGSSLDVIAIIKVLKFTFDFLKDMDIYVSIIAMDKNWKNASLTVLQCSEHFSKATWKIDFIYADFSDVFNDKVKHAIKTANIISMVKFFSELEEFHIAPYLWADLFQNVHEITQLGTLLFVLDFPMHSIFNMCGGYSGTIPEHSLLYETLLELYTLDETVVEKLFLLYKDGFPNNLNNCTLKVFARIWLKTGSRFPRFKFHNDKFLKSEKSYADLKMRCAELNAEHNMLKTSKKKSFHDLNVAISKEILSDSDYVSKSSKKERKRKIQEAVDAAKLEWEENLKLKLEARDKACEKRDKKKEELMSNLPENTLLFLNGGLKKVADARRNFYQQCIDKLLKNLKEKYPEAQKTWRKF